MKRIIYDVSKWVTMEGRWASGDPLPKDSDTPAQKWHDEVFARIYDGEQQKLPPDQTDKKWETWSERFHRYAEQCPDFLQLQEDCRGDLFASVSATDHIYNTLKEDLENPEPPPPPPGGGGGSGDDDSDLRQKVQEAIKEASEKAQEAKDLAEGFGPGAGTSMGNPKGKLNGDQIRKWMKVLRTSPKLKQIAELAGRFRRIAAATRKTLVRHAADEVMDVEQGNDLSKMLPQEAVRLLGTRGARLSFLADYAAKRLQQYRVGGYDNKALGPVIVALDKSGSMAGQKDYWATAVALAVMSLAQKDRRPFVLVTFRYSPTTTCVVEPGEVIPLDVLLTEASGGTDADRALRHCLDIVKKAAAEKSSLRKADIIFVTDGDCPTEGTLKAEADALDCRIVGIGIGCEKETLTEWSHESFAVPDTSVGITDDLAATLFAERI
jgi:Mg-chelatase subunit ChlD